MNRVFFFATVCGALVAQAATTNRVFHSPVEGVSDEEWAKLPPKEKMMRNVGGVIPNKTTGKGFVALIDAQGKIDSSFLRDRAEKMEDASWFKFCYSKADPVSLEAIGDLIKKAKGNASVVVVDAPGVPPLMTLPDYRATLVNVAALSAGADEAKLKERVAKELSRAFIFTFGVFEQNAPSIADRMESLKDLDLMPVDMFPDFLVMLVEQPADKYGLRRYNRIFYKHACEQGIAPAPKNKWQQRLYDAAKAKREAEGVKGIKIEFDKQKGK